MTSTEPRTEARLSRERLDAALVARGLVPSRSRARDLVRRGAVMVDGAVEVRPAAPVSSTAEIAIRQEAGATRVSRGALKLEAGLEAFGFDPRGRVALDVGASTGGFTEILLERGAARVYAVDVGRDQLHPRLRADPRVVVREGMDARAIGPDTVPERVGCLVADVSFISLTKLFASVLPLAAPGAWLVALIKPQFELEPADIGKGGVVRHDAARERAVARIVNWFAGMPDWRVVGVTPSPIVGGSGNVEFLLGAVHAG